MESNREAFRRMAREAREDMKTRPEWMRTPPSEPTAWNATVKRADRTDISEAGPSLNGPLRWLKTARGSKLWHLSWDGAVTICGRRQGYPLTLSLGDGPPVGPLCTRCRQIIGVRLGLK